MATGQIDAALLEQIKERTPILSIIGRDVPLKRSGGTHVGCCPFHGEKTPSFHVYTDRFKCFGCGESGDVINYVQKMNRSTFPETVRDLAQQAGLEIPGSVKPLTQAERDRREQENAAVKVREDGRQRRHEADRLADHEAIRQQAHKVWNGAVPADPNHPYLVRKGLAGDVEGLKQDNRGNLLVPRFDRDGQLWNIERILPEKTPDNKDKFTLSRKVEGKPRGGRVDGVFAALGSLDAPGPLGISTGLATAKSIRRATNWTMLAVGSDNNLLVVAQAMRERFPDREIIILGDNDIRLEGRTNQRGEPMENQGRIKAEAAAKAVGGIAIIPPFPDGSIDSDHNDYERIHGTAALAELLKTAHASLTFKAEKPMPDASGPPEPALAEPLSSEATPKPDLADVDVNWRAAVDRLQAVHDNSRFAEAEPDLLKRTALLLNDLKDGANLQDEQTRTRIAYLISDIDRVSENSLALPPTLRSEVDHLAVSYPDLTHPDIQEMLRQTASMSAADLQTIRDVRILARDYVNREQAADPSVLPTVSDDRIRGLEVRIRDALAGPEAPPHVEIPEHHAAPVDPIPEQPPQPRPSGATPQVQPQPTDAPPAQPQIIRQPPGQMPGQPPQQAQAAPQQPGTINVPTSAASRLLDRLSPSQSNGPPPWQGVAQAISSRLGPYQEAQADRRHRDLERSVEVAGKAAVKALASLETGPAADVMRKIGQEATRDPNGVSGVIEQMRPGGRHETLRNEFNEVFAKNAGFGSTFDRAKVALSNYLENRNALEENYHRRGWNVGDMDEKLKETDRAIAGVAERVPGRQSGKSLTEELAKKAMELAEALFEKIKQAFGRGATVSPEVAAATSSSPSMSPSP